MRRKGEISLTMIIGIVIALLVLVVSSYLIFKFTRAGDDTLSDCSSKGGVCKSSCDAGEQKIYGTNCENSCCVSEESFFGD